VSHNTARSWLSILEASYLVLRLPPLHANVTSRLVKTPKLHFYDSGLLCGGEAEVLAPAQLRARIAKRAAALHGKYADVAAGAARPSVRKAILGRAQAARRARGASSHWREGAATLSVSAMAAQLALFPGLVPLENPPAPPIPEHAVQREEAAQLASRQMGLFDAQVQRLRAAIESVAAADLSAAASLLESIPHEIDPVVPIMKRRVAGLREALERVGALPPSARVAGHLELGRSLAAEPEPWAGLGRALIARAALGLAPTEGVMAARLLLEARESRRAKAALQAVPGSPDAALLFALGDVEVALGDRPAARRHYCDALLLDPFDESFERIADEQVSGLPYVAEYEVEVEGNARAWSAPVGIIAGVLPRPRASCSGLPIPARASPEDAAILSRARQFVDALVLAASPDAERNRDTLLEARRRMKRASAPLFAWYMARRAQ
jgi:hypothetical protein